MPNRCLVPVDASGSPSSVSTVVPTRDFRLSRRLGIVGIGIVVGVTLAAVSMRMASREPR